MNVVEMSSSFTQRQNGTAPSLPPERVMNDTKNQIDTASRSSGAENVAETPAQNSADSVTPSREELGTAVDSINQFVSAQMRTLNFSVDENSGKAVVKVIDFETKDVIRQIPGEEVLKMASAIKRLQDDLGSAMGLLINKQV